MASRPRYIRFGGDLEQKVADLAEAEDLPFSLVVKRLVKQALAGRAFDQHQSGVPESQLRSGEQRSAA